MNKRIEDLYHVDISLHEVLQKSAEFLASCDIDDAQKICQAFDVSTEWLNEYRDRTDADGNTSEGREGRYGGMVKK